MPTYAYLCQACATDYEERRPLAQIDAPSRCPECGSLRVRRRLSTVTVLTTAATTRSSGGCACSQGGSCGCRAGASHS